jgi:hypothetical protein
MTMICTVRMGHPHGRWEGRVYVLWVGVHVCESRMCSLHRHISRRSNQYKACLAHTARNHPPFGMTPTTSSTQERVATRDNSNARWPTAGERRREGSEVRQTRAVRGIVEIHFEETRSNFDTPTHRHHMSGVPVSGCAHARRSLDVFVASCTSRIVSGKAMDVATHVRLSSPPSAPQDGRAHNTANRCVCVRSVPISAVACPSAQLL